MRVVERIVDYGPMVSTSENMASPSEFRINSTRRRTQKMLHEFVAYLSLKFPIVFLTTSKG